jgi:flavin reductase (DIM6/NTAB) family NADH-FMN oxidoreductase RutF
MTASAVSSLSLDPVQLLVCISNGLPTLANIRAAGRFAVNVLRDDQADVAMRFADPTADRFAGLALRDGWESPALADAIAVFDCRVAEMLPGGDHTIVIGDVVACENDPDAAPLVYWASSFGDIVTRTKV